jgi:hypothetical protein
MKTFYVSHHAVSRWSARVSSEFARRDIEAFVGSGRVRPNPRGWMREVSSAPGVTFMYSAEYAGVCAVIREGVVVTFLTRALFRGESDRTGLQRREGRGGPSRRGRAARKAEHEDFESEWKAAA